MANAIPIERVSVFTPDSIAVGMRLYYKGDHVPFVATKHLISKGAKTGRYLLPAFALTESGATKWTEIAGSMDDTYVVVSIERNRTGAKGQRLEDLVHVKGNGYAGVTFGLVPADLCAKFGILEGGATEGSLQGVIAEDDNELSAYQRWKEETAANGW